MPFAKGHAPWAIGKGSAPKIGHALRGQKHAWVGDMNKRLVGENARHWRGDEVGYGGIHTWIKKKMGQPLLCSHCNSPDEKRYEWANISGEYKRDLNDWVRLCRKCHIVYDKRLNRWGKARRYAEAGGLSF